MKRPSKRLIGAALALALAGVAMAAVVWGVATTPGARWLLAKLSPLSGVSFSAQKVEGGLIDHLRLTGVRIGLARQKIEISHLELRWQPLLLLGGTVAIKELGLQGVRIQDDAPLNNKPPVLAGPRLSGKTPRMALKIAQLRVTDLSYRRRQAEPVRVSALSGSVTWQDRFLYLALQVKATGLDLAPELNVPTGLSGTLNFAGTLNNYRGDFTLASQAPGWQAAVLSATYQGTGEGLKLAPLQGSILDGVLAGSLEVDWRQGLALRGEISGRNLNPARLAPDWQGVANFTASGNLAWAGDKPLTGKLSATLLESRLHGQALTGALEAGFAGGNISLARLDLQGKGFDLHASGELDQRLTLAARVSDFSKLVPGATGTLQSEGWLRWRDHQLSGALTGTGGKLAYADTRIGAANLTARLDQGADSPLHLSADLQDVVYDAYKLQAVALMADGTLAHHNIEATLRATNAEAHLALAAGYQAGSWAGEISRLAGRDQNGAWSLAAPAQFVTSAKKFTISPLALTAGAAERLEVAADLGLNPLSGQLRAQWSGLSLARANGYLKEARISGSSDGTALIGFLPGQQLSLAGNVGGSGIFSGQDHTITFLPSRLTIAGSEQGLRASTT